MVSDSWRCVSATVGEGQGTLEVERKRGEPGKVSVRWWHLNLS